MKRREFLKSTITAAGVTTVVPRTWAASPAAGKDAGQPALLGGQPVRTESFPSWPLVQDNDRRGVMAVLDSGDWYRGQGQSVDRFEEAYADLMGAAYCIATTSGTGALVTSLNALDVGPGDEVLVPPYTFMATITTVLMQHALPVFVDSDLETSQIDARKIEAAITPETACILPVHLGGSAADLDTILAVAGKHGLPVLEDACQSHLGEWRHKKLSTLGSLGCFSFQNSKNLTSGEGGAVITNDRDLAEKAFAFHNCGRAKFQDSAPAPGNRTNLRMTEFQARLLIEQMTRLEGQARTREENAAYLNRLLKEIPGVMPARQYEGCTRNAYHLYMARYDSSHFSGLPRARFLKALHAEGIPCSGGYSPLNREEFIKNTVTSRAYQKIYGSERIQRYLEQNDCPVNDRLCQEALWFGQTMLLGTKRDMDQIAEAIRKIQTNGGDLARS
ncbi:MAG: aminotransferase class I/II-fold pyridoxal phosphate-dependent enzyme [Acidobacteriota bacterium]